MGSVMAVIVLRILQALAQQIGSEEAEYHEHQSPPSHHDGTFGGENEVKNFSLRHARLPRDADGLYEQADLTGVINLWQTKPGVGRFRGNSLISRPQLPHAGPAASAG